jgi:signal peptidase I
MIKKRNPVLAAVLSFLAPGLGHVYAGDAKKAAVLIGIEFGAILLLGLTGLLSTFYGLVGLIAFAVVFYIYVIVSSIQLAHNRNEYQLKAYNRWYWYVGLIIVLSLLTNVIFGFRGTLLGYETYSIPAQSMDPALQVGDFITVDTRYKDIEVSDVIVFPYPENRNILFVKRVAALGNDTVSIVNGEVIRNGKPVPALSVPADRRQFEYSISMQEIRIPENEIFVLGDWRDNSRDSRTWGTVPARDIIGKVTYIWYSKDLNRIGKKVE